jgi:hypothetical protein
MKQINNMELYSRWMDEVNQIETMKKTNLPIMAVQVNEFKTVVVDSGANASLIARHIVEALGLHVDKKKCCQVSKAVGQQE